jgi:hypothetical protein
MNPRLSFLPALLFLGLLTAPCLSQTPDAPTPFPPVKLRAYGTLSAEQKLITGAPQSSVLVVTCDNAAKAQLVLAKYLSDLAELPGVTPLPLTTPLGPVAARRVDAQGAVAAVRCGRHVSIFTAADGPALQSLIADNIPTGTKIDATEAEIPVPMYLDRWDKYGFRFYYGPLVKPRDAQHRDLAGNYDPRQDLDFADKTGKSGLVVWNSPFNAPTADGITDLTSREWVYRGAKSLGLPLGINDGITDDNIVLANRFPNGVAPDADGYIGGWYYETPTGIPTLAWSSTEAQEAGLSQIKNLITGLTGKYDNIVNWLEPHEETHHGVADLLDDHGADAAKSFRQFLKSKYGTVDAVARRYGAHYGSWNDVPFPEMATFFGWNSDAVDLTGSWKISYDAPYSADSAKPELDDSSWPSVEAPGNAIIRLLPRKPAVFRRHITLDPTWKAAHPRVYLYLWDLENTRDQNVLVFVNGQAIPEKPPVRINWHWCGLDITPALKDGDNLITYCLPGNWMLYRSYLSGDAPGVYPALSPEMNARWADFSDWTSWSRGQAIRRGMQMIRQVDPDRPITLMSPGNWWNDYKASVEDYGAILHDTGGMAGFWNDINPAYAQSTGLPSDCEPGGPASTLDDFKKYMGRWSTENTQGVDYFGHLGDVFWNPAIKDYFEKTLPIWHVMGKYHLLQPEVGELDSARTERLFGYPFNLGDHGSSDPDLIARGPGVYASGIDGALANNFTRGSIIESDFARGTADQYRVVVDANTSILDPDTVDAIAAWVKRGGTFVTFEQTGRHTSTRHDVWPISKLTGYDVLQVDHRNQRMHLVPGQTVLDPTALDKFTNNWGLDLKKNDPTCQDIVTWDDGTVAVGIRKLGKGTVIDFGMFDSESLIVNALNQMKLRHVAGEVTTRDVIMRAFVSNNGLFDVWTIWNQQNAPVTTDLLFHDGYTPASCHDLNTGESLQVVAGQIGTNAKISQLALDPLQTRILLTPRGQLTHAPAEWLTTQRNWWKGTADPGPPIAPYTSKLAVNLSNDWAFKPIDAPVTGTPPEDLSLCDPNLDDSSWKRMPLGIFDIPDNTDVHHAVFRRKFTVPANWNHGTVAIFGKCETPNNGGLRRYIDGHPLNNQTVIDPVNGLFAAGSTHLLTVEVWGAAPPLGTITPTWITYLPDPLSRQPLVDGWNFAHDFMTYSGPNSLPATITQSGTLRTEAVIDPSQKGRNVVLHVDTNNASINGMIFNGHWYAGYGNIYSFNEANVTPFVKYGQKNEIVVVLGGNTIVKDATLNFYDKKIYP